MQGEGGRVKTVARGTVRTSRGDTYSARSRAVNIIDRNLKKAAAKFGIGRSKIRRYLNIPVTTDITSKRISGYNSRVVDLMKESDDFFGE